MKKRNEQIKDFYAAYADQYAKRAISIADLRGDREDLEQDLDMVPGILEDRIEELKEWLIDLNEYDEAVFEELFSKMDQYLHEGIFLKNPISAVNELIILLKGIIGDEDIKNTQPYYIIDNVIKAAAVRGVVLKRRIVAIEKLLNEIRSNNFNRETALIEEFAAGYEDAAKAYNKEQIATYLKAWVKYKGYSRVRSKAKKEACLEGVADGTLTNWENRWKEFRETRTGNSRRA